MSWTDERVELLKKLWAEGLSCSQIASRLGRASRNAVIGKVHRLGLPERAVVKRKTGNRGSRPRSVSKAEDKRRNNGGLVLPPQFRSSNRMALHDVERRSAETDIGRVTFDELAEVHCRYVVGDVRTSYKFCGSEKVPGLPYCADHAARCYAPPKLKTPHRGPVDEALEPANDLEPAMKETI